MRNLDLRVSQTGGAEGPAAPEQATSQRQHRNTAATWEKIRSKLVTNLEAAGFQRVEPTLQQIQAAARVKPVVRGAQLEPSFHMCPACGEHSARLYSDEELGQVVARCGTVGCASCTAQHVAQTGALLEGSSSSGSSSRSSSGSSNRSRSSSSRGESGCSKPNIVALEGRNDVVTEHALQHMGFKTLEHRSRQYSPVSLTSFSFGVRSGFGLTWQQQILSCIDLFSGAYSAPQN